MGFISQLFFNTLAFFPIFVLFLLNCEPYILHEEEYYGLKNNNKMKT